MFAKHAPSPARSLEGVYYPIWGSVSAPANIPLAVAEEKTMGPSMDHMDVGDGIQRALLKGTKKWGRSKIMIVGEGRAGKSAFANVVIGKPFEDTASTIGIGTFTCDIKYANVGGSGWSEYKKPAKEMEAAVASMIANGMLQQEEKRPESGKRQSEQPSAAEAQGATRSTATTIDEENEMRAKLSSSAITRSAEQCSANDDTPAAAPTLDLNPDEDMATMVGKFMDENSQGGAVDEVPLNISHDDGKQFDNELVMKCLSDKIQTDSKFIISVFDFGGQSVFNVSVH